MGWKEVVEDDDDDATLEIPIQLNWRTMTLTWEEMRREVSKIFKNKFELNIK